MGMEHGFSTSRADAFPAGLRVLVVDDDPTWLKILEKMLKKCCYEVTTCGLAREALRLLRDKKDGFDIVISDVNMPDMDGFRLLEHVGLEMDLPVIMMSVDGETSRVMKGVQHGACDYLLKPIRMKELQNIWQHVLRKRMHDVRDIECFEDRTGTGSYDGFYGGDQMVLKKRKDIDNEKDSCDPSTTKKARVVWTVDLHQKFVKAVNQLGIDSDKIGPKKILDLMNVRWLTRENVASHLQKYRLYLSRIREEDKKEISNGGMKDQDHSPKESSGSFSLQNSSFGQQNDITSEFINQENHLRVQTVNSKPSDNDAGSSKFLPLTEHKITFGIENCDPHTSRNSLLEFNHIYGSMDVSIKHASFGSPVSGRYPWSAEVPDHLQFEPEFKPHPKSENGAFNQIPILQTPHISANLQEPAPHISSGPSISKSSNIGLIDIKPLNANEGDSDIAKLSPMEIPLGSFPVSNTDAYVFDIKNQNFSQGVNHVKDQPLFERSFQPFPVHSESHLVDPQGLQPMGFDMTLDMKKQISCQGGIVDQSSVTDSESLLRNQVLGSESASEFLTEDLMFQWLQCTDVTSKDFGLDYKALSGCNFLDYDCGFPLATSVPKLDSDYLHDWGETPVDRLLFS